MLDVGQLDGADPGRRDALEIDFAPEGQAREDGELVRSVDTVDVERGIRLGISEPLRLLERQAHGGPFRDVVRRATEWLGDLGQRRSRARVTQDRAGAGRAWIAARRAIGVDEDAHSPVRHRGSRSGSRRSPRGSRASR